MLQNRYAPADITVGEMAELAKNELNSYIRRKNAPEPTTPDASDGTKPNNHENPANNTDRMGPDSPLGNGRIPAGDASAYVPRGTEELVTWIEETVDKALDWKKAALANGSDPQLVEELFRERLKPDYCPEEPEPITISEEQMAEIVADLEKIAETM